MFIKTLYPNTKIHVRKVEGTLMTYTNELEVKLILVMLIQVFGRIGRLTKKKVQ
jgi:hypothetical protein